MFRLFLRAPVRLVSPATSAGGMGQAPSAPEALARRLARAGRFVRAACVCGLVAGLAAAGPAHAQSAPADPPDRVARLSEVSGQAWLYDPDRGEWIEALRNRPVTTGNRLATDAGAHAELQLGSTTLRLDQDTELEVVQLDDDRLSLRLHNGSVEAQVRDATDAAAFELTTEDGRFVLEATGRYRFDRRGADSDVTVFEGQARYERQGTALAVVPGQRGTFWIDSAGVAQYTIGAPIDDAFARWSRERDRRYAQQPAPLYVSPEMTGAQDLDRYGNWEQTTEYGAVWTPYTVPSGWAPYSAGHWAWVSPWGWTWVDDAPWGYAPFHYGRWVHFRNRWCWTPGVRVARPVYAPALVAWVGGPHVNVSISVGGGRGPSVGWFPLAPREVYVPSYRVSPRYVRNINITNVTNVTTITRVVDNPQAPRHFANRGLPDAVTLVPASVMTGHRPVAPAAAQWRGSRGRAGRPDPGVALLTAPVAAPERPARPADPRAVQPPPGVVNANGRSRAITPGSADVRSRATAADAPRQPWRGGEPDETVVRQRGLVDAPENHGPQGGVSVNSNRAPARIAQPAPMPAAAAPPVPPQPMLRPQPMQGDAAPIVGHSQAVQPGAPERSRRPTPPPRAERQAAPVGGVEHRPVEVQRERPRAEPRMHGEPQTRSAPPMRSEPQMRSDPPMRTAPPMRSEPVHMRPGAPEAGRGEARHPRAEPSSAQSAERRAEPPRRRSDRGN